MDAEGLASRSLLGSIGNLSMFLRQSCCEYCQIASFMGSCCSSMGDMERGNGGFFPLRRAMACVFHRLISNALNTRRAYL